jgi:hypothetical protein
LIYYLLITNCEPCCTITSKPISIWTICIGDREITKWQFEVESMRPKCPHCRKRQCNPNQHPWRKLNRI